MKPTQNKTTAPINSNEQEWRVHRTINLFFYINHTANKQEKEQAQCKTLKMTLCIINYSFYKSMHIWQMRTVWAMQMFFLQFVQCPLDFTSLLRGHTWHRFLFEDGVGWRVLEPLPCLKEDLAFSSVRRLRLVYEAGVFGSSCEGLDRAFPSCSGKSLLWKHFPLSHAGFISFHTTKAFMADTSCRSRICILKGIVHLKLKFGIYQLPRHPRCRCLFFFSRSNFDIFRSNRSSLSVI